MRTIHHARLIFSAIPSTSKGSALVVSSDQRFIEHVISDPKTSDIKLDAARVVPENPIRLDSRIEVEPAHHPSRCFVPFSCFGTVVA
jgi:hypothetical protein